MSKLQRDLKCIVLVNTSDSTLCDVTNRSIYDYWRYTPVFSDFVSSQCVPDWCVRFMRSFTYSRVCRDKWFKNVCHNFRSYIMRHFYFVERRDCLDQYELTCTKDIDLQKSFDL